MARFGGIRRMALATAVALGLCGAASAAQAVEIEYWQYFYDSRVKAIDTLIAKFEADNPGITVKHTNFPYADYQTKVAAAIPAGEGPDVVQLFYGWLDNFVAAKLIQPLPIDAFPHDAIEADFFPMVKAMKRGDDYYGLPTAVRSLAIFWNKRLFEEAGLDPEKAPANLDELVQFAQKLTKKDDGGNLTQVGITMDMNGQDHQWWREVLVRQFGGEPYLNDYKTVNYADAAGAKALQYYLDFQTKYGVSQLGFMDEGQAAFKAGRAGMTIDGSFRLGSFDAVRGLKYGVAELPAGPDGTRSNYASYWVNAITTKAQGEKLEASKKFLAFLTSPEAMQIWLETVGELPARRSVALSDKNIANPVYAPFIKGLDYAHTTLFVDEAAERQVSMDMVNRVVLQNQPVDAALAEAAKAEQEILDRYYQKK